jgi:hypothetical protein
MIEKYVCKDTAMKSTFNFKPNYTISFHRGNKQVGVLDFNGPEMTFGGDMDESAKLFLELVATSFKTRLEQERAEEREACAKVCEDLDAWNMDDPASTAIKAIRARGQVND